MSTDFDFDLVAAKTALSDIFTSEIADKFVNKVEEDEYDAEGIIDDLDDLQDSTILSIYQDDDDDDNHESELNKQEIDIFCRLIVQIFKTHKHNWRSFQTEQQNKKKPAIDNNANHHHPTISDPNNSSKNDNKLYNLIDDKSQLIALTFDVHSKLLCQMSIFEFISYIIHEIQSLSLKNMENNAMVQCKTVFHDEFMDLNKFRDLKKLKFLNICKKCGIRGGPANKLFRAIQARIDAEKDGELKHTNDSLTFEKTPLMDTVSLPILAESREFTDDPSGASDDEEFDIDISDHDGDDVDEVKLCDAMTVTEFVEVIISFILEEKDEYDLGECRRLLSESELDSHAFFAMKSSVFAKITKKFGMKRGTSGRIHRKVHARIEEDLKKKRQRFLDPAIRRIGKGIKNKLLISDYSVRKLIDFLDEDAEIDEEFFISNDNLTIWKQKCEKRGLDKVGKKDTISNIYYDLQRLFTVEHDDGDHSDGGSMDSTDMTGDIDVDVDVGDDDDDDDGGGHKRSKMIDLGLLNCVQLFEFVKQVIARNDMTSDIDLLKLKDLMVSKGIDGNRFSEMSKKEFVSLLNDEMNVPKGIATRLRKQVSYSANKPDSVSFSSEFFVDLFGKEEDSCIAQLIHNESISVGGSSVVSNLSVLPRTSIDPFPTSKDSITKLCPIIIAEQPRMSGTNQSVDFLTGLNNAHLNEYIGKLKAQSMASIAKWLIESSCKRMISLISKNIAQNHINGETLCMYSDATKKSEFESFFRSKIFKKYITFGDALFKDILIKNNEIFSAKTTKQVCDYVIAILNESICSIFVNEKIDGKFYLNRKSDAEKIFKKYVPLGQARQLFKQMDVQLYEAFSIQKKKDNEDTPPLTIPHSKSSTAESGSDGAPFPFAATVVSDHDHLHKRMDTQSMQSSNVSFDESNNEHLHYVRDHSWTEPSSLMIVPLKLNNGSDNVSKVSEAEKFANIAISLFLENNEKSMNEIKRKIQKHGIQKLFSNIDNRAKFQKSAEKLYKCREKCFYDALFDDVSKKKLGFDDPSLDYKRWFANYSMNKIKYQYFNWHLVCAL